MLELYIFNKENQTKNGLSRWDENDSEATTNLVSFNLDKFKVKDGSDNLCTELIGELNRLYKESDKFQDYFNKVNSKQIDVEFRDDYHHLLIYDSINNKLILDSKIVNQFTPIYFWAFYYALARQNQTEDLIYQEMFEFFSCFDFRLIDSAIKFLERDREGTKSFDAGSYLLNYLKTVFEKITKGTEADGYLATQLLRNRALAGRLPYKLSEFEAILNKYANDDPFSGEACQEYFDSFNTNYDQNHAKIYYKHLLSSLKKIGLKTIAQRGSRVAHEQGPILVNATSIIIDQDFELSLRKARSSTIEAISKLEDAANKFFKLSADFELDKDKQELKSLFAAKLLNINLDLDNLLYLSKSNSPKARFLKSVNEFRDNVSSYSTALLQQARSNKNKEAGINFHDAVRIQEKNLLSIIFDLNQLLEASTQEKANSVVYIQRPSSRSGHFIARLLLGQKLYIETDKESEKHRLNGIPYNFVSPDFDLVASGLDSFFENASISVVTDRQSGKPDIKWENAEDLAISLAPGMHEAIKAAQSQGKNFHYQLETTLLGPLIEIFLAILENEISNVASIETDNQYKHGLSLDNLFSASETKAKNPELEKIIIGYQKEINEAADFCFKYYLLEDEVQSYMLQEGLDRQQASQELLLNLYDVQRDVAKYCLLKKSPEHASELFTQFKTWSEAIMSDEKLSAKDRADQISQKLNEYIENSAAKIFVKKYIRYPESTARKEYLEANPQINRINITSNKSIKDADFYFDLSVAPSRIDFGKHVVASITTIMGRMIGANDPEALIKAKEYIDFVSQTQNSIFESAAEAGSVKVIENTCRAIQYSKAISFQGVFQSFAIDGALARSTINSRNDKASGLHVMEYGTMASTGYCITKEPLFILLGLAIKSDTLFDYLGVETEEARNELRSIMAELMELRTSFSSDLDWQMHIYQEMAESKTIQKYLANPDYKWLPNLKSIFALFKYLADYGTEDQMMSRTYAQLSAKLIEYSRIINETGIIQRIQLMNSAIKRAKNNNPQCKDYKDLVIALNASYKGNVSDERENANQYLIAFILQQKQYIKNTSLPEIDMLIEHQIKNYPLPKEIRIYDPLVDPQTFMGGELEARAESAIQKIVTLELDPPLTREVIEASIISYGSDYKSWRLLSKLLKTAKDPAAIKATLDAMQADLKYLETYSKGFYKDPLIAYQGVDVIQLNSDHDRLIELMEELVTVKTLMQTNNPESSLVLLDNPQQAKRPLLDYDKSLEWMALGGTVSSHLISEEVYERWKNELNESQSWAKLYIQKLLYQGQLKPEERSQDDAYLEIKAKCSSSLEKMRREADLKRDLIIQKYKEAQEIGVSHKTLKRYSEWILTLSKLNSLIEDDELNFNDWLVLGGRWILNGQSKADIYFIVQLFDKSQELKNLGKHSFQLLELFTTEAKALDIEVKARSIENAGSTKEADLLVSSAADSLEYRAQLSKSNHCIVLRMHEFSNYQIPTNTNIERSWDNLVLDYLEKLKEDSSPDQLNLIFARMLKTLVAYSESLSKLEPLLKQATDDFCRIKEADHLSLTPIFGDHRKHKGVIGNLAAASEDLAPVSKLSEMFIVSYLIMLTAGVEDENEIINKLAIFFDQYLNVHEEDYPPYIFHSLCAGASYGFNQDYYLEPNLRAKMFKLAAKSGMDCYKILQHLIARKSVLKHSSQEYRDSIIGDYDNGMIAICYQQGNICIEERFWSCMRALRNFIRNYHDRHPLPIVIKGADATVSKLFRYKLDDNCKLNWIAGLSNIGKHSWDLNCVFRSPLLRDRIKINPSTATQYINISVFTPFLTEKGEIKQIYTSFRPEVIEEQKLDYLSATEGYQVNDEGFVHAVINLEPDIDMEAKHEEMTKLPLRLPKPNIIMSAHTHPQYINGFTLELGIPEVWSMLSMQQMYAKTELPKILKQISLEGLVQIDFMHKEFESKSDLALALDTKLKAANCDHIDSWLLKASRDSGGRGISGQVSIHKDRAEILNFIFEKTRTDDLVMQEFVPNNARAFILPEFLTKLEDSFIEAGIAITRTTPYEQIFFAMRSFQSISGIKGYLFSANIGAVTVNAGQGAKMFYGEPSYIMPLYIAGKIQKLMDEQGEAILKEAIPKHALEFAKTNNIPVVQNQLGSSNCVMLNGLFDYIPYVYAIRDSRRYILNCKDNSKGGIDYSYNYQGEETILLSGDCQKDSLDQLENLLKASANNEHQGPEEIIDIDLAKIELNSGLGQANLLQKAIEDMAPENRDVFLEWTEDLGDISSSLIVKN